MIAQHQGWKLLLLPVTPKLGCVYPEMLPQKEENPMTLPLTMIIPTVFTRYSAGLWKHSIEIII